MVHGLFKLMAKCEIKAFIVTSGTLLFAFLLQSWAIHKNMV